jgi:membrane protein
MTARMWAYADRLMALSVSPSGVPRRRVFYPLYVFRVLLQVGRQWARDRCPQKAAALAFQTALSLVPLVAVGLALLRAAGQFGAESALVEFIARQVLPVSREEISARLLEWSRHVSVKTAGTLGVSTVLVLAFLIAASVERIWNDIWRAEVRRPLWRRALVFYAMATLVPALIGVSLYHGARYGFTTGLAGALFAFAATTLGLVLAHKLVPVPHVRWASALCGAVISAILFELAKHGFKLYVANIAWNKYAGIYGAIGLLPLTLLWIYYTWLVVLFGAEVAFALQHLDHLERLDRRTRSLEHHLDRMNGEVAARVMCAIAAAQRHGQTLDRDELGRRFDLPLDVIDRLLRRLIERGLLHRVDGRDPHYGLARPAAAITLHEILAAFRGSDVISRAVRAESKMPLDRTLTRLDEDLREKLDGVTLETLLPEVPR